MIRVLHILDKISYDSGVSNVILNYYFHMEHSEVVFDFLINEPIEEVELYEKLKNIGSRVYVTTPLELKNLYRYKRSLFKFFCEHPNYKIVHGHMPNLAFVYLKVAKDFGIPIRILHCHSTKGGIIFWKKIRNDMFKKIGIKYATNFIACSKEAGDYLLENKKTKLVLLKNAIDSQKFLYDIQKRNAVRAKLGIKDEILLGHIGRFSIEKNHIFLINILEELIDKKINVKLLLIGDGKLVKDIKQLVEIKNIQDYVIFAGQQKEIGSYLCAMDLFLFPSFFEGSPVSLLEAQANGLHCLVSDRVTKEIIISDLVEYLSISSHQIWVEKILSLSMSSNLFRKDLCKELQRRGYDINLESKRLINFYIEIMEKHNNEQ